jgi:Xaa-Pro dipeptidase
LADAPDANPARHLRDILAGFNCRGQRLGVEYDAYGLTAKNGKSLEAELAGFCTLEDASDLVSRLRVVKSPAEMVFVSRAAELADLALDQAHRLTGPGADEGDILAAMQGGDFRRRRGLSGQRVYHRFRPRRAALPLQGRSSKARSPGSTHAGMGRSLSALSCRHDANDPDRPGHGPSPDHVRRYPGSHAGLHGGSEAGHPIGEVFDAYARTCDAAGMREHRLNATGCSLGAVFAPNWMDWPTVYHGNPVPAAVGMVFFLHMILMDSDTGHAMCFGHTVTVTNAGCEALSRRPLDLAVK